jgi:predicted HAD superfamily Cof-like phosphohydrolase
LPQTQLTMDKLDSLNQVAEFHRTFKHPVLDQPTIPAPERCELRVNLLAEELKELQEAIDQQDLTGIADALCDLQYVLSGAVLEFGLGEKFRALFDEVQRSNMSKACDSLEEAEATREYYLKRDGTESYIQQDGDHWLVFRTSDNKTLKSVNYSPPDLEGVLKG